jgi:cyanuric acid amidohydrolase
METPSDVSALRALLSNTVRAEDVIAIVGKTEGTGLGKDQGRETADACITGVFAETLGLSTADVRRRLSIVLSGGTPGVLTPHIAVFSQRWSEPSVEALVRQRSDADRLAAGTAHSADIAAEEVGRIVQVNKVATAVTQAMTAAGISDPADVHLVMVKAPALTAEGIADATRRGKDTVTTDLGLGPEGAMCYSNDASALGVAVALGEVNPERLRDEDIRRDWSLFSSVAMTSSGGEKTHAEVFLLGNSSTAAGSLRIGHHPMHDILDSSAVSAALAEAGLDDRATEQPAEIVYLLAKMIIPGSSRLNGRRITLADDPLGYHVAKAMGGYLLASTTGQTMCFVSGGERNSHQGPPDGNPLAAIVRVGESK